MPNFYNVLRTLEGIPSRVQAGKPAAGVSVILVLACLGLTACGGSSGSSTTAAAAGSAATSASGASTQGGSTGGSSTPSPAAGTGRRRFSAIRECLQKNGVTLPKRTPGSGAGAFPGAGGRPVLPKGMTRGQFEAALKKCGGSNFGAGGRPGGRGFHSVSSPAFKQALTKYAECLRQNGINLPAPNTSGKGPIFSTKGIHTASPQFKAATMKCRASLVSAFRRPQGSGAAGATTAPAGGKSSG
jgi:hypothetical protein